MKDPEALRQLLHDLHSHKIDVYRAYDSIVNLIGSNIQWNHFDMNDRSTYPSAYGKYLVKTHNDKIHFEVWNGTQWSYNQKIIHKYTLVS